MGACAPRTLAQQARGLLRLHHGLVARGGAVPEEGGRHICLLHVHDRLGHCTADMHHSVEERLDQHTEQLSTKIQPHPARFKPILCCMQLYSWHARHGDMSGLTCVRQARRK